MSYFNLAAATKTARAAALNSAVGVNAQILIYTGSQPATPDTAASGTLLATLPCSASAFGTVSGGVITLNAVTQANATGTGTAGWARITTSGGTAIIDVDVATSGASLILNTVSIVSGGPVQVTSGTITEA